MLVSFVRDTVTQISHAAGACRYRNMSDRVEIAIKQKNVKRLCAMSINFW